MNRASRAAAASTVAMLQQQIDAAAPVATRLRCVWRNDERVREVELGSVFMVMLPATGAASASTSPRRPSQPLTIRLAKSRSWSISLLHSLVSANADAHSPPGRSKCAPPVTLTIIPGDFTERSRAALGAAEECAACPKVCEQNDIVQPAPALPAERSGRSWAGPRQ